MPTNRGIKNTLTFATLATLANLTLLPPIFSSEVSAKNLSSRSSSEENEDRPLGVDVFDSPEQSLVFQELSHRQASVNKAFGDYFDAMMSNSPQKTAAAETAMHEQQSKVGTLLNEQHSKTQKMLFGRYYFRDGSSAEIEEYKRNPQKYAHLENPNQGQLNKGSDTAGGPGRSPATSQNPGKISGYKSSGNSSGDNVQAGRNDVTLDGSNIPRELVFPGKKTAQPQPSSTPGRRKSM
jgi:hypothetical protein